jgi:2-oxoglutarate ferredoxin oxidoreductase subunit gamma
MADQTEIRITGLGGQGVILATHIIGDACSDGDDMHASMMQSFGPEARGSSCTATLVVSDTEVHYPYVRRPDVLVAMSADGYETYAGELKEDGVLIYEESLVQPDLSSGVRAAGIPSTRIAESLGRTIVQNIVMVGFFTALTGLVSREAMRTVVEASVPVGSEELNLKAFDRGFDYAVEHYPDTAALAARAEQ